MTLSKSFTAAGASDLLSLAPGQSATYDISGTFTGVISIDRSDSPLSYWNLAKQTTSVAISGTITNESPRSVWLRFRAAGTITGTAVCALVDVDDVVRVVRDLTGKVVGSFTEAGPVVPVVAQTRVIAFVIDGGGSVITTGVKGDLAVPFACTIVAAELLADQSGSIVLDVWKDVYANYPPTVLDTITASAKPTLASALKAVDNTLTGWTTAIAAGDTLRVNVDSVATLTRCTLQLTVTIP